MSLPRYPQGWKRFLAFGCTHVPLQDPDAFEWLLSQIRRFKPHVLINMGDWFEADSASRWPSEYDWTFQDELRIGDGLLRQLRFAYHRAERIFLPGNHDDNILALDRLPRKIRGMCDWRIKQYDEEGHWINQELLCHWRRPCDYVYDRVWGVYRIGQVTFSHGFEAGVRADDHQAVLLGLPHGLSVFAHTHRPYPVSQVFQTRRVPLPYWTANVGCLRHLKPVYVRRQSTHLWGHACLMGAADPNVVSAPGRHWDAELHLFRTYEDWTSNRNRGVA